MERGKNTVTKFLVPDVIYLWVIHCWENKPRLFALMNRYPLEYYEKEDCMVKKGLLLLVPQNGFTSSSHHFQQRKSCQNGFHFSLWLFLAGEVYLVTTRALFISHEFSLGVNEEEFSVSNMWAVSWLVFYTISGWNQSKSCIRKLWEIISHAIGESDG